MKKHIVALLVAIIISPSLYALECTVVNGVTFYYSVNNSKARIESGSDAYSGDLVIPSKIDGYPVDDVYITDCPALRSVSLPDGMTYYSGVRSCPLITEISVPDSVIEVADQAFYGNRGLIAVKLSSNITKIQSGAFWYCENLKTLDIPDKVTEIEYGAFQDCTSLERIKLSSSLTDIGNYAFRCCSSLGEITIPATVKNIGNSLLSQCTALTNIVVEAGNERFKVVNRCLVSASGTTLIAFPGADDNVVVPTGVTATQYGVFQYNGNVKSVRLPATIVSIGDFSFEGCSSLTNIFFEGNAPSHVGKYVFTSSASSLIISAYADTEGWPQTEQWQGKPLRLYCRDGVTLINGKVLTIMAHGPSAGVASLSTIRYGMAAGLGAGRIIADGVSSRRFFCTIVSNLTSTTWQVSAQGYKVGESDPTINIDGNGSPLTQVYAYQDGIFDSYLYGWQTFSIVESTGEITQSSEFCCIPERSVIGTNHMTIPLPTEKSDVDDKYPVTIADVVFSKEYLSSDNMGDINRDGIPDIYREFYSLTDSDQDDDLASLTCANDDEDFIANIGVHGSLVSGIWNAVEPFTAKMEIRGYGEALNNAPQLVGLTGVCPDRRYTDPSIDPSSTLSPLEYLAWTDYTNEHATATIDDWSPERPSDPTKADTDGDGIDDGTEYWWWYRAHVGYFDSDGNHRYATGRRYSIPMWPEGETITPLQIKAIMDPIVQADAMTADSDGDGLPDLIEVEIGTNPFDYDSDGDGLPDGYEIHVTGTDPLKMCSSGVGQDQDSIRIGSVICWCDGNFHKIPVDNPTTLQLLWSTALDASFSESQPTYSEPGVYTNWCYAAFTPQVGSTSGDYPELVVRSGVRMATITITPLADGQHGVEIGGKVWHVTVTGGEAVVDGCDSFGDANLLVPSVIGGCPVVGIADRAFYFSSFSHVELPGSLREIGEWSFAGSSIVSLAIPAGVKRIGNGAFSSCQKLISLNLPSTLETIGMSAFLGCDSLSTVMIPGSVVSIGIEAFGGCKNLLSISVDAGNANFSSNGGLLLNKSGSILLTVPAGLSIVVIPESVSEIYDGAFYFCSRIQDVALPDSVMIIGDSAFAGCSRLSSIDIPEGVTCIGHAAFQLCSALTGIELPSTVTSLGSNLFGGCEALLRIDVRDGNVAYRSYDGILCDSTGARLLAWPEGRADVIFPPSVTAIAPSAFYDFDKLTEIVIPAQIRDIDRNAFDSCRNLLNVYVSEGVRSIGDDAFCGCSRLESISLPKTLDYLGHNVFFLCNSLTSVRYRGDCPAFVGAEIYRDTPEELTTYVPSTSTGWGTSEFPSTWQGRPIVNYLGDGYYSKTLDGYTWYFTVTDGMVEIGRRDEDGVPVDAPAVEPFPNGDLNVPEVLLDCPVVSLGSHAFARCYDLVTVYLPDAVTNIGASAFADCERLEYVYMPSELKSIGQYAFAGCSALPDAYIPWGVETIASAAYADCSNLGYVYIGECLRDVGSAVFANCPSLGAIDVDGANPCFASYDGMLFDANLTQLFACPCGKSTAELPSTLSVISDAAFIDCGQLAELFIPADVGTIGSQAFSRCDSLLSVTFDGDCPEDAATTMFLDSPEALVVIAYKDSKGWPQTGTWCGRTLELRRRDGMCEIVFDPSGGCVCETSRLVTQGTPIGELPVAILEGRVFEGWRNEDGVLVDSTMVVKSDIVLNASWLFELLTSNGTLRYRMTGGVANLVQGVNATGEWNLPTKIGGADIVMIEDACFAYSTNLVSVSIPDSVTNIGAYAFYDCRHLQKVEFGNGLAKIDSGAFAHCVELDCIATPSSLRALGNKVERCRHDIGEQYEYSSSYLTNFIDAAGSTVCYTNFSRGANRSAWALGVFEGCTSLSDVSLNDGLQIIGAGAFKDCSVLCTLLIPETVSTIGGKIEYWYESDSSHYGYSASRPIGCECAEGSENTSVSSSAGCTYRDAGFVEGCHNLEEISLPTRLEYLGPFSFYGCEMLTSVTLPSTLTTLYQGTFSGCSWLSSVVLPENLELIGGVEPMPNSWYYECSESSAYFNRYYSNTSRWHSVDSSELNFVDGKWICVNRIVYNGQPSVSVNTYEITDNRWQPGVDELIIPYNTNDWAWIESKLYSSSVSRGVGLMLSDEERVALMRERHRYHPADATYNYGNACSYFDPIDGVFSGCYSLENVEMPSSVRRIGDYTFYDCCNLLELEIPNGLSVLGFEAFGGECSVISVSIPWLNFGDLWEVFPSHAYMTNVKLTSGPRKIADLDEYLNDVLNREYPYYERQYLPESIKCDLIRRYFSECWVFDYPILAGFPSIQSLAFPNGLESFDWSMGWYDTSNLTTIEFPNTLRELGNRAFCEFRGGQVVLPPTIQKIGNYAFGYSQVTNLVFLGNAPKDVSPTLFTSEDEWTSEFDAALTVYVYPGTTGWDAVKKTDGLPANGLWPTTAALFRRRPITYVDQPIEQGGLFAFRDEASEKMVSVPQEWLAEYGLLKTTDKGTASVASLSPISSRSLYQSYVAGLDPTDEEDEFTAKIEIVDGEVKVSWEPELPPEKAALRKYTTYGSESIGGNWQDMSTVPEADKSNYRFFKVTVEMP